MPINLWNKCGKPAKARWLSREGKAVLTYEKLSAVAPPSMLQQIETMLDEDFTSESVSVPSSLRCIDNPNAFSAYRCSLL